jgi:hypothetical protein
VGATGAARADAAATRRIRSSTTTPHHLAAVAVDSRAAHAALRLGGALFSRSPFPTAARPHWRRGDRVYFRGAASAIGIGKQSPMGWAHAVQATMPWAVRSSSPARRGTRHSPFLALAWRVGMSSRAVQLAVQADGRLPASCQAGSCGARSCSRIKPIPGHRSRGLQPVRPCMHPPTMFVRPALGVGDYLDFASWAGPRGQEKP